MEFPFYDAPNTATIIYCHIINGEEPILFVSHDEDDGMCGIKCFKIEQRENSICFINGLSKDSNVEINKLFNRFYKGDYARHHQSTGLGLSIVKRIVEVHEWSIQALIKDNQLIFMIMFNNKG